MFIRYLIYFHAVLGGFSLLAGLVALSSKKGSDIHRRSGRWFYRLMLITAISSGVISVLPGHENTFLLCIAVFSIYLLISGKRAALLPEADTLSCLISAVMLITAVGIIAVPFIMLRGFHPDLLIFASIGLFLSLRDLLTFRSDDLYRKRRISIHAGNMTGGYIAATTAFIVVNHILPGIWAWLSPTVLGTAYIIFQLRKYRHSE